MRPSLIPERLRPLVLSPIYLLRFFVNAIFVVAWAILYIFCVILAPIPIQQDIISIRLRYKILLAVVLVVILFGPSAWCLLRQKKHILQLLDRVERLAAGDILDAAALAYDLSRGAKGVIADQTLKLASESTEAAHKLANKSRAASRKAYESSRKGASRTAKAVYTGTGKAAKAAGKAAKRATVATGHAMHDGAEATMDLAEDLADDLADFAEDFADEASHLLQNAKHVKLHKPKLHAPKLHIDPDAAMKEMGAAGVKISKLAATTTVAAAQATGKGIVHGAQATGKGIVHGEKLIVSTTSKASHFVYESGLNVVHVSVDKSKLAAGKTYRIVETAGGTIIVVANKAVQEAMDNLQKLLQLSPIVIFKRVVRTILKALLYIVIGAPILLWIVGKVLWKLGIQPSALEAMGLAYVLAVIVCPIFVYVRWKALNALDKAGGEMIHLSIVKQEKEKEAAHNIV